MKKAIILLIFLSQIALLQAQTPSFLNLIALPFGSNGFSEYTHVFAHDSCYYVEGHYQSSPKPNFKFFLKMDKAGNIIKSTQLHDDTLEIDYPIDANEVIPVTDGIINATVGHSHSNYLNNAVLIKLNFNLDTLWIKRYSWNLFSSIPVHSCFNDVKQTFEGGLLLSGFYRDTVYVNINNIHPFLMKTDEYGNIQWLKKYTNIQGIFNRIEVCPDHGILILTSKNYGTIIKTSALGDIQWQQQLTNTHSYNTQLGDLCYAGNYNYILAVPYVTDFLPYFHYWGAYVLKFNSISGLMSWDTIYNPYFSYDYFNKMKVRVMSNGEIKIGSSAWAYFNGDTTYTHRGVVLTLNSYGDSIYSQAYKYDIQYYHGESIMNEMEITPQGEYLGVGTYEEPNFYPCWFFKTQPNGYMGVENPVRTYQNLKISPNPASNKCVIDLPKEITESCVLYDINGNLIRDFSNRITEGSKAELPLDGISSGPYFILLKTKKQDYTAKIIIEK